ncbi:MAG: glycoside hydrolase family 108 protein, partial [Ignavibacteriales bacterium]
MSRFEACLAPVLQHEGGYVDRRDDRGGPTNLGCTIKTLSKWRGCDATRDDVKALTKADVEPIYKAWYWDAAHCGELPAGVDYMVFDLAINSGAGRAVQFLQRAVKVTPDGKFGPVTRTQVASRKP